MSAPGDGVLPPLSRWPAVSVVIPARDCAATLEAAVVSALEQRFDGSVEVVLAVAPSRDATEEVADRLGRHPRVRWRFNAAGTTPAGLNLAISSARGDVIVRLDAHAVLPPGYVARALELLGETGAGNVGGMQVPVADGCRPRAIAAAMASPMGAGRARYRVGGPPGDVETVYLGVFRREALETIGGFDPSLARNQDYELNHRLRAAGFRVYFHPDLRVEYRPRARLSELARQYYEYGAWKRRVLARHPRSVRPRQLAPPGLVVGLVATAAWWAAAGNPWPFAALAAVYGAALAFGAATAGVGVRLVPVVAAALAVMHLAWGVGFLAGWPLGGGMRRRPPGGRATMGPNV